MEKITKVQTRDLIAEEIKKLIYLGQLEDGEEITQNQIASLLGLSRMPVREAFQSLEMEGLLTRLENRHVRVNGITRDKARAIFSALVGLEKGIADFVDWSLVKAARDEKEWHLLYAQSTVNEVIVSTVKRIINGYPSFFFERNVSAQRFALLSCVSDRIDAFDDYLKLLCDDINGGK